MHAVKQKAFRLKFIFPMLILKISRRYSKIPPCMKGCGNGSAGKICEQRQVKHDRFSTHKSA
jgi:hypothetical protein